MFVELAVFLFLFMLCSAVYEACAVWDKKLKREARERREQAAEGALAAKRSEPSSGTGVTMNPAAAPELDMDMGSDDEDV